MTLVYLSTAYNGDGDAVESSGSKGRDTVVESMDISVIKFLFEMISHVVRSIFGKVSPSNS